MIKIRERKVREMEKRRLLVFALCVMMVPCLMAGGTKDTTTASGERVKITYSFWGTPDEGAAVQGVADKFNATQNRITVEVLSIPHDTYVTKLNTMATAKQLPDCGIMNEAGVLQFAENGLLHDISKMYGAGDSKPLESLTFKYKGTPVAYSAANEVLLLYYNKDMFDKAGVPYPPKAAENAWNWDQFVETAKLLTLDAAGNNAKSPTFNPNSIVQYGCMVENLTWQLEVWCLSNGSGFYSKDGSKVTINDPAAIDAIQKIADLHLVHKIAPLSAGADRRRRAALAHRGNLRYDDQRGLECGNLSRFREERGTQLRSCGIALYEGEGYDQYRRSPCRV
jgi:multiple sugar transport system substrate-binding protein